MDWVNEISSGITTVMESARVPAQTVPGILLLCEATKRPGLSASVLAGRIISRLHEIDIPTEKNPDGSDNLIIKVIKLISEEVVTSIKDNAVVFSEIPSGGISITGVGGNIGGPIVVTGKNDKPAMVRGLVV